MAVKKHMTEAEFNAFCAQYNVDPVTGLKTAAIKGVEIVYAVENHELNRAVFDEWAAKMRAQEEAYRIAHEPPPKKRWRLRWVQE